MIVPDAEVAPEVNWSTTLSSYHIGSPARSFNTRLPYCCCNGSVGGAKSGCSYMRTSSLRVPEISVDTSMVVFFGLVDHWSSS